MYTYGADPELFVWDTSRDQFVSAHDLIPGTKEDPFKVEYGAIQRDGLAAEFNIDPATNFKEFFRNITEVRKQLLEYVQRTNKAYVLRAAPTATFDLAYFRALPKETKVLGCDPDFCAATGRPNPRPNPKGKPVRTGGGHFHIGWGTGFDPHGIAHFSDCRVVINNLYHNGFRFDSRWDNDDQRRRLYGSAFSFRPKSFGVEARYLSNAWVDNPDAMKYVSEVGQHTIHSLDNIKSKSPVDYNTRTPKSEKLKIVGSPYTYITKNVDFH